MLANKFFPEMKGVFGFGCMRLPMKSAKVDAEQFTQMIDAFLDAGFNYFDTAHGYLGGASELAIGECLASRIARDRFLLTNKLTEPYFNSQDDIRPFFERQLGWCKVDYFNFYLMHAQDKNNYPKFKRCKAYETACKLKDEGLIRHFGISFHDKAETLDMILTEHPEIEIVQIQFNYLDYESASVESRKVYEVCQKHGKPVLVMEPVKGGSLVKLPKKAAKIVSDLDGGSPASYAIRFAASFPQIAMVLSGMSDMAQMRDNVATMKDFKPLSERETQAIRDVCDVFSGMNLIPCTACRYCVEENHCPKGIRIPDVFSALNTHNTLKGWNAKHYYDAVITGDGHGKASECIKCGMCEKVCPQHLEIRKYLQKVAKVFGA